MWNKYSYFGILWRLTESILEFGFPLNFRTRNFSFSIYRFSLLLHFWNDSWLSGASNSLAKLGYGHLLCASTISHSLNLNSSLSDFPKTLRICSMLIERYRNGLLNEKLNETFEFRRKMSPLVDAIQRSAWQAADHPMHGNVAHLGCPAITWKNHAWNKRQQSLYSLAAVGNPLCECICVCTRVGEIKWWIPYVCISLSLLIHTNFIIVEKLALGFNTVRICCLKFPYIKWRLLKIHVNSEQRRRRPTASNKNHFSFAKFYEQYENNIRTVLHSKPFEAFSGHRNKIQSR